MSMFSKIGCGLAIAGLLVASSANAEGIRASAGVPVMGKQSVVLTPAAKIKRKSQGIVAGANSSDTGTEVLLGVGSALAGFGLCKAVCPSK